MSAGTLSGNVGVDYERFLVPAMFRPWAPVLVDFAWWADGAVDLPEGRSAIYTQPMSLFALPFLTTSRIVDNDEVHLRARCRPFF